MVPVIAPVELMVIPAGKAGLGAVVHVYFPVPPIACICAVNYLFLISLLRHENVIEYKESFIDINTQTLCLVMEFAE